ncbi:MAG: PSD1 and planctomycete cytochrome C domain-containing protein [Chthoniobacteraceae bacterium]
MTRIPTSLAASLIFAGRLIAAEPPDVQRIFAEHCLECHGPDKAKGGLRLTSREAALKELKSGARAVVPGDLKESELIARIVTDDAEDKMPPKDKKPLKPAEIETLKKWVAKGAEWPVHWAYLPVQHPAPPAVQDAAWPRNEVDRFVLAALDAKEIKPSPEADRYTLIRRLSYDLLGLPPTPEEADAFVADTAPDAYQKLADRLLASPHFGERWGRHWLDRARYADSDGYEKDNPRPDAWRYRDWVIDAVNRDLPFDQFTIEQLAGDLLPKATPEQKLATAFHRQTLTNTEGGTDKEQFRVEATFDRTETTASVWLAHTFTCARCHTHKYDRLSQNEYYQLFAFFNDADETTAPIKISDQAVRDYDAAMAQHGKKLKDLEAKLATGKKEIATRQAAWEQDLRAKLASAPAGEPAPKPAKIVSVTSKGKTTFKALPDGSQLATGKASAKDTYTVVVELPAERVSGLRLEVLPDDSLPGKGPGRSKNGNFVLSEFTVRADTPIALHSPSAEFSQGKFPVTDAIDGKTETGWALSPQFGRGHHATFYFGRALDGAKTKHITVTLDQQYQSADHVIGRFRIVALTGETLETIAPLAVREVLEMPATDRGEEQLKRLGDYFARIDPVAQQAAEQLAAATATAPKPPTMDVRIFTERTAPRETKVLHRGEFLSPTDPVEPGGPAILPPIKPRRGSRADRLDLARWLVSPENPLTPRVIANQFWGQLFGEGIVRTPGDFGVRGEKPTHPELLDWLASEFVKHGWSRKQMIRLIVTSATYRQRSDVRPELTEIDPLNQLLARQNRVRVEGEIVRDLHLAASGLLSTKVGGPSVFPPLSPEIAKLSYANNFKWTDATDENRYRRGMYTFFKRTAPYPDLITFDCPDANLVSIKRNVSNTPLQALTTLNAQSFAEAARGMAKRLLADPDDAARVAHCFRLCVARPPQSQEIAALTALLGKAREYYAAHADEAKTMAGNLSPITDAAALTATARIVMNTDEFITRE